MAITNQALRDLSGRNGLLVRDWIEQHKDEVISYNAKFGMDSQFRDIKTATVISGV